MIIDLDTKAYVNPRNIEYMRAVNGFGEKLYVYATMTSGKVIRIEGPYNNPAEADARMEQIGRVW